MEKHISPGSEDNGVNFEKVGYWEKPTAEVEAEVHPQKGPDVWINDPTATPEAVLERDEKMLDEIREKTAKAEAEQEKALQDQNKAQSLSEKIKSFFGSKQ